MNPPESGSETGISKSSELPEREIRARFDETTIRVYQAYSPEIADKAIEAQTFVPPFSRSRMTWIKPSFTWMMYRSGWAGKPGQERILGIDILRSGFEWALAHSCLSHFDPVVHESKDAWKKNLNTAPVRIQWDPERTLQLQPLSWRAIQVGLGPAAVNLYVEQWIKRIEDITILVKETEAFIKRGEFNLAQKSIPREIPYPLAIEIGSHIRVPIIMGSSTCFGKSWRRPA